MNKTLFIIMALIVVTVASYWAGGGFDQDETTIENPLLYPSLEDSNVYWKITPEGTDKPETLVIPYAKIHDHGFKSDTVKSINSFIIDSLGTVTTEIGYVINLTAPTDSISSISQPYTKDWLQIKELIWTKQFNWIK